jgi:phosphatidylserine/phosphatidylglycerophosphate/cardiolipin synthase-like enzyme
VRQIKAAFMELASQEILVGFPEDGEPREDMSEPTNAMLAYIHDNGAPEQNIPARPFMIPAIEGAQERIAAAMVATAKMVVNDKSPLSAERALHRVGTVAELAVKRMINSGIPPPLADATLRNRVARGRKGAKIELKNRAEGIAPSTAFAKPLVDTGQMRNAVKYVIRERKRRK